MLRVRDKATQKPVDTIAIVTDKVARKTEAVDVDRIDIEAVLWNRDQGMLQVSFRLGGVDSQAAFRPAYQYGMATFTVTRRDVPWTKYNLDSIQSFNFSLIENCLHEVQAVQRAAADVWRIQGEVETVIESE